MVIPSFTFTSFAPLSSSASLNNNIEKKKTKFEFPIAVGKTLRVMDLCGGKKIVVRNLDPGDERVEISSFLSSLSSLSSSSSRNEGGGSGGRLRLKAEKLENGDVYAYTVSDIEEEEEDKEEDENETTASRLVFKINTRDIQYAIKLNATNRHPLLEATTTFFVMSFLYWKQCVVLSRVFLNFPQ